MSKISTNSRYSRYKTYHQGAIYHIYNRGNGKQDIFLDDNDYRFYLNRLAENIKKYNISLICYALMPNHIHLVVKQNTKTPIYKLISSLHTSYSMYFNKKYKHTGHLFQDRFKQVLVETDEQLLHLSRYIHLNPLNSGFAKDPLKYFWSSYQDFIGTNPLSICNKEIIINLLSGENGNFPVQYTEFCKGQITNKDGEIVEQIVIEAF
ncbi:MAG: transposase [Patescibacteria group bacterium]